MMMLMMMMTISTFAIEHTTFLGRCRCCSGHLGHDKQDGSGSGLGPGPGLRLRLGLD